MATQDVWPDGVIYYNSCVKVSKDDELVSVVNTKEKLVELFVEGFLHFIWVCHSRGVGADNCCVAVFLEFQP